MKLSPDHKRSDFKIKSIRIIQPDLQAKEIQIIDVKEIYKVNKFVVCLQCRKDKAIYDILKQLATVRAWYRSANRK